jgi:molecular chaperone IbpA
MSKNFEAIEELLTHPGLLGFSKLIHDIQYAHGHDATGYPPRNIIQTGEDSWVIEVAVAGFRPEEIGVELIGNRLNINGTSNDEHGEIKYVHQGMARRNWIFTIQLGDHVKVDESKKTPIHIQHGLLMISLVREIPEAAKPKQYKVVAIDGATFS